MAAAASEPGSDLGLRPNAATADVVPTCRDCGRPFVPVQRGECLHCGSDSGPRLEHDWVLMARRLKDTNDHRLCIKCRAVEVVGEDYPPVLPGGDA